MTTATARRAGRVPRWWVVPSCGLAVLVAAWELQRGSTVRWALTGGFALLMAGLAATAGGYRLKVRGLAVDRLLLWTLLAVLVVRHLLVGPTFGGGGGSNAMFLTGVLALLIGLELTSSLPERRRQAARRLIDRGVVEVSDGGWDTVEADLDRRTRGWDLLGSFVIAGVILAAWLVVLLGTQGSRYSPWVVVFEVVAGWVAGGRIGCLVAYGAFWRALVRDSRTRLRLVPGHLDGAGGFKPLGDFCLYQSLAASVPAIYLAAWWWLIPAAGLDEWRAAYAGLLVVAILLEVLAFFLPMLSIHHAMQVQRDGFLADADRLSGEIARRQARLRDLRASDKRQSLKDEIAGLSDDYQVLLNGPTWPLDPALRRRFGVRNLLLLLPLVGEAVGGAFWQRLADTLGNLA